jgi:hypothetical protein
MKPHELSQNSVCESCAEFVCGSGEGQQETTHLLELSEGPADAAVERGLRELAVKLLRAASMPQLWPGFSFICIASNTIKQRSLKCVCHSVCVLEGERKGGWGLGGGGETERVRDGRTDGRTDGETDGRTEGGRERGRERCADMP